VAAVAGRPPHADRLASVEKGFCSLPERYLGADPGFDATYRIRLGDLGHTWEVRCTPHAARVCKGGTRRQPDVILSTDSQTWLTLRAGELSGVDAFTENRLHVSGNLDHAIAFEGLFRLLGGRRPLLEIHDVPVGRHRISTLSTGSGPDVLLLHGLGGTRASLLHTASALSRRYRVHAPDLPGFGSSCKPAVGRYNAGWFGDVMVGLLDALEIDRTHIVGNSMGGRIAIEMGLARPDRVGALALLCPAVAFVRREFAMLVKVLRPEFGMLPHSFGRKIIEKQFWSMFADRDKVDPVLADVVVDEFERIYRSPGARLAFLSSARAIYLEKPFGAGGFYPRLSELQAPAMFVWGTGDKLIPSAFSRHVEQWLPTAEQVILEGCGHVPQVERPEQTNGLLRRFFAHADAMGQLRAVA
jgi:pimeloyl-ACP methyl ester carboxylesterase